MTEEVTKAIENARKNEKVIVTKTDAYRDPRMPNYVRIGIMKGDIDVVDLLEDVSHPAFKMYIRLRKLRNTKNNLATLPAAESRSETVTQSRSLKELIEGDFIRKVPVKALKSPEGFEITVPKRTYIINPIHLLPRDNTDFTTGHDYWDQL